jgi:hypothetical protein
MTKSKLQSTKCAAHMGKDLGTPENRWEYTVHVLRKCKNQID